MANNEPAEDRSVRGNTIKPAKVEPKEDIEGEFLRVDQALVEVSQSIGITNGTSGVWTISPDSFDGDEIFIGGDVAIVDGTQSEDNGRLFVGFEKVESDGDIQITYANDGGTVDVVFNGTFYDPD